MDFEEFPTSTASTTLPAGLVNSFMCDPIKMCRLYRMFCAKDVGQLVPQPSTIFDHYLRKPESVTFKNPVSLLWGFFFC